MRAKLYTVSRERSYNILYFAKNYYQLRIYAGIPSFDYQLVILALIYDMN